MKLQYADPVVLAYSGIVVEQWNGENSYLVLPEATLFLLHLEYQIGGLQQARRKYQ